jgi:HSP20 family protein
MEERMSRLWGGSPFSLFGEAEEAWTVPLDVREQDGEVIVEASVPGANPENLDVSFEDGVLTIKGETKSEREEREENYLLKERRAGSFYRAVRLPDSVDPDRAESDYHDGILRITMPKMPEKQPHKIQVKASGERESMARPELEGKSGSTASAEETEL